MPRRDRPTTFLKLRVQCSTFISAAKETLFSVLINGQKYRQFVKLLYVWQISGEKKATTLFFLILNTMSLQEKYIYI